MGVVIVVLVVVTARQRGGAQRQRQPAIQHAIASLSNPAFVPVCAAVNCGELGKVMRALQHDIPLLAAENASFGMTAAPNNTTTSADRARGGRCPQCAAKTEFCICNDGETRRRTMAASSAKVRATRTRVKTLQLDRKCAYVSESGRTCRGLTAILSLQCAKHTCSTLNFFEPKTSAVQHCSRHRAAGPPAPIAMDPSGYLVPGAGSNPE